MRLYSTLVDLDDLAIQPVLEIRARSYDVSDAKKDVAAVSALTRAEVSLECPRFEELELRLDETMARIRCENPGLPPAVFGTYVHSDIKKRIEIQNNPNFKAEHSYLKQDAENTRYGVKGSIRVGAYENLQNGVVCVYDFKTGDSIFSFRRMQEMADMAKSLFPATRLVVVTDVKGTR